MVRIITLLAALLACPQGLHKRGDGPSPAELAWERVIAAKGGRQLLHSIKTLGIVQRGTGNTYSLILIEFPSKYWSRALHPSAGVGHTQALILLKANGERGIAWSYQENKSFKKFSKTSDEKFDAVIASGICNVVAPDLLETKWYKPKIVAVDEGRWDGKSVQVIYVKTCFEDLASGSDSLSAYVVDLQTHLPLAFCFVGNHFPNPQEEVCSRRTELGNWVFSNYESFNGLILSRGSDTKTSFDINPKMPPD